MSNIDSRAIATAEPQSLEGAHARPFHFVLATIGTRGDLNPLLAIADELLRLGHKISFAAPRRYRALIEAHRLRFHLLRPDAEERQSDDSNDIDDVKRNSENALRNVLFPGVELTYRDLLAATEGADLIAGHHILLPLSMAAERRGIPWAPVYFAPGVLNSMYDPPVIPMLPWLHGVQRSSHYVARTLNGLFKRYTDAWYAPYRDLRAREGLPAEQCNYILDGVHSPFLGLGLFSEVTGARQPDWAHNFAATGFPFIDEPFGPEHEALQRFLDEGAPPIVATLGTSKSRNMRQFFETSMEATRRLGRRIVLLTGKSPGNQPARIDPAFAFACAYAPYAEVFKRACAIIHSGAIGALAEALRSGRPMLVVPAIAADQPDNAFRAVRLGVAQTLSMPKYNADTATHALRTLLTDEKYAQTAAIIGERVRNEDGAARAASLLIDTAARHHSAGPTVARAAMSGPGL